MVAAVEIQAADRFLVAGERCSTEDEPSPVAALAAAIYRRLYTRAGAPVVPTVDLLARRDHLTRLSEANGGRGTWEAGWTVRALDADGRVGVERDGLTVWAARDGVRCATGEIAVGARCRVKMAKELSEVQPGFYIAVGDGDPDDAEPRGGPLLRIYWHLSAEAAVPFIRLVTAGLNALRLPFRAKVLSDPGSYRRADAGVLYLDAELYPSARRTIAAVYRRVRGEMLPEVPQLTLPLAPGLAVAEDPGGSESFGQHRCRLVAQGLWRAWEAERATVAQRVASVVEELRRAGLDPQRPHLSPGSLAVFRRWSVRRAADNRATNTDWLAAARRIGDALCRTAFWHDGRCGWMGRSDEEAGDGGLVTPTAAALGGDLERGTAGVALFLARLYEQTGEPVYRDTARGTASGSGGYPAESLPQGAAGVPVAAADPAAADPAATARALERAMRRKGEDTSLGRGVTGLCETLWTAGRRLGEPRYCALAESATRRLLAWYGASGDWPSGTPSRGPNPSLMLGTAGVGYWLLRLHSGGAVPSVSLRPPPRLRKS